MPTRFLAHNPRGYRGKLLNLLSPASSNSKAGRSDSRPPAACLQELRATLNCLSVRSHANPTAVHLTYCANNQTISIPRSPRTSRPRPDRRARRVRFDGQFAELSPASARAPVARAARSTCRNDLLVSVCSTSFRDASWACAMKRWLGWGRRLMAPRCPRPRTVYWSPSLS